jgi:2-dehydropantoate 2-reductase
MNRPSFESVAVMGAGAVGCYFGAVLADAGKKVRLIGRQALVDAVTRDGLRLESAKFSKRIRVDATTDPAGVHEAGLVLFAVKSPDTETVAAAIAPHLAPEAVVLSLQNGVDNFERLRARIANAVVPAVVYVAAEITAPGVVRHNGRGDLVIGAPRGQGVSGALIADLAAFLAGAKIPTRVSDNIEGELWTKLLLNGAYNAISALGRSNYGRLVAMPEVQQVMREAVAEILALARAKGVRLDLDDPMATVLGLASMMPEQMSSTAQDLARRKPTEIDHLNGYIVRESDALGLPVPVNRTLAALVKLAEGARSE